MSAKKLNENDFFNHDFFIKEAISLQSAFDITALDVNSKIPNYYSTGGISGGYYIDVYDNVFSDKNANKLASFSYGYTTSSVFFSGSGFVGNYTGQKLKIYKLFAKTLLGDENKKFKIQDKELNEAIFVCIPRNQYKDSILKRSTIIWNYIDHIPDGGDPIYTLSDILGKEYNEFCGPYIELLNGSQYGLKKLGLLFNNAGVYVINPEFSDTGSTSGKPWSGSHYYEALAKNVSGTTYNDLLWSIKHRFSVISFSSSQKVCSGFIKCTAGADEFNYSTNPSFLKSGQNKTALSSSDGNSNTYITSVGLYGENQELLAVAKLSRPIKKNPDISVEVVVRLDY